MLYECANKYIINCNNYNEGEEKIYQICCKYFLHTITNEEAETLKKFFNL